MLRFAHESESKAKSHPGKNAYCLTILKHSGEITQYCHSFSSNNADGMILLQGLIDELVNEEISTSFIYQLSDEFERFESDSWQEMMKIEAKRILGHSSATKAVAQSVFEKLNRLIDSNGDDKNNFLNLMRSVAFISKQRGGSK